MEERTYAKSLPSLKKLFENKLRSIIDSKEQTEKLTTKQKSDIKKEEIEKLHLSIDKYLEGETHEMEMYIKDKDTTKYWKAFSNAVEKGWLKYIDNGKEFDKKAKGRGELIEIKFKPKRETRKNEEEERRCRGEASNKAHAALKQARRAEQMAFRITLINDVEKEEEKRKVYFKLNLEAIKGLTKHGGKQKWEKDMMEKLKDEKEAAQNTMLIPMLKRTAGKYHDEVQKHRKKAEQDRKQIKVKLHEAKNGGQWAMCKDMGGSNAAPLIALRRQTKGPKGQQKGTVATSPTEIDAIIRDAYGKYTREMQRTRRKKQRNT